MCWRASLLYPPTLEPASAPPTSTYVYVYLYLYVYIYCSFFTPALYMICMHNMFMSYMNIDIYMHVHMFFSCFTPGLHLYSCVHIYTYIHTHTHIYTALLLLHYCFTSLYKFITPAFTPAVLIHMLYFCMLTPEYIIYIYIYICVCV
jgi:hypothetical protein